jgi:homeobox-leucine zipper protein
MDFTIMAAVKLHEQISPTDPASIHGDQQQHQMMMMKKKQEQEKEEEELQQQISTSHGGAADPDAACMMQTRKKLRLSKNQSALLEDSFKQHSTLNPVQHFLGFQAPSV